MPAAAGCLDMSGGRSPLLEGTLGAPLSSVAPNTSFSKSSMFTWAGLNVPHKVKFMKVTVILLNAFL